MINRHRAGAASVSAAVIGIAIVVAALLVTMSYQSNLKEHRAALAAREEVGPIAAKLAEEQAARKADQKLAASAFLAKARRALADMKAQDALGEVATAIEFGGPGSEALLLQGQILAHQQRYAEAGRALESYLELKPADEDTKQLLTLCRHGEKQGHSTKLARALSRVFGRQGLLAPAADLAGSVYKLRDGYEERLRATWPPVRHVFLRVEEDGALALELRDNLSDIRDLWPLQDMCLNSLTLRDAEHLADLGALRRCPLKRLDLRGCESLSDIGPLKGASLEHLVLSATRVSDLRVLAGMPLKRLELNDTPITDLSALKGLPLEHLELSGTKVEDLRPLKGMPLRRLALQRTGLRDLSTLQGLPLEHLELGETRVQDLSPLAEAPLRFLGLRKTEISALTPLKSLKLTHLFLDATPVSDLAALQDMPLTHLSLRDCDELPDLSPLRGMPLTSLDVWGCHGVAELTPLKGRPLKRLDIGETRVSDLSPLAGMPIESLCLLRTSVSDLTPLEGMQLTKLSFSPESITKGIDAIRSMNTLRAIRSWEGVDFSQPHDFWLTYDVQAALKARNPSYNGRGDVKSGYGKVYTVGVDGAGVTDLTPLKGLPLREFYGGNNPITDLSPLKGMPLQTLFVWNTKVADISPVKGMPLRLFSVTNTPVSDLSPLAGMSPVTLSIDGSRVTDLTPLKGMRIEHLAFTPANITKGLEIVRAMGSLHTIGDAWERRVPTAEFWRRYDAGGYGRAPLGKGPATEEQFHAALKAMNPGYNGAGKIKLEDGKIVEAILRGCGLADLSPLRGLPLRTLNIWRNHVSDLSPLKGMPLTDLDLASTPVTDLSPLAGMKLQRLIFNATQITRGWQALREMKSLKILEGAGEPKSKQTPEQFWQKWELARRGRGHLRVGDVIYTIGDALTGPGAYQRYLQQLIDTSYPGARIRVVNCGASAWVASAATALRHHVEEGRGAIVLAMFGTTLAQRIKGDGKAEESRFVMDLRKLTDVARERGAHLVFVAAPPFAHHAKPDASVTKLNAVLGRLLAAQARLAKEKSVPVVDVHGAYATALRNAWVQDPRWEFAPDGVLPTSPGHAAIASEILRAFGGGLPLASGTQRGPLNLDASGGITLKAIGAAGTVAGDGRVPLQILATNQSPAAFKGRVGLALGIALAKRDLELAPGRSAKLEFSIPVSHLPGRWDTLPLYLGAVGEGTFAVAHHLFQFSKVVEAKAEPFTTTHETFSRNFGGEGLCPVTHVAAQMLPDRVKVDFTWQDPHVVCAKPGFRSGLGKVISAPLDLSSRNGQPCDAIEFFFDLRPQSSAGRLTANADANPEGVIRVGVYHTLVDGQPVAKLLLPNGTPADTGLLAAQGKDTYTLELKLKPAGPTLGFSMAVTDVKQFRDLSPQLRNAPVYHLTGRRKMFPEPMSYVRLGEGGGRVVYRVGY